eukprot:TRINITY_DN4215_c0_g1_i1.p1 TRINITY_DN4215_c0_g1~~TRINITY_DN4215_c0_g1_i1.p1  ORF type:complete len:292 (+),score=63.45 TRINITY_DN4215_c0_g1_i1:262-1137(+)
MSNRGSIEILVRLIFSNLGESMIKSSLPLVFDLIQSNNSIKNNFLKTLASLPLETLVNWLGTHILKISSSSNPVWNTSSTLKTDKIKSPGTELVLTTETREKLLLFLSNLGVNKRLLEALLELMAQVISTWSGHLKDYFTLLERYVKENKEYLNMTLSHIVALLSSSQFEISLFSNDQIDGATLFVEFIETLLKQCSNSDLFNLGGSKSQAGSEAPTDDEKMMDFENDDSEMSMDENLSEDDEDHERSLSRSSGRRESVDKDLDSKLCTFTETGNNFTDQHWYYCYTRTLR